VISARDEVDAGREQLVSCLSGQAEAAGDVFAVDDAAVNRVLLADERNAAFESIATR
jgi:hypothetical protein